MNSKLLKRIISITLAGATAGIPFAVSAVNADAADTTSGSLSGYYATNAKGFGAGKTITVDGDISDWDSTMLISQGSANDDPRVYRPDSMYEVGSDLYALYAAYDDDNLYLMWEMTNVQDAVCPDEEYPLENGTIYSNGMLNYPFLIAVDTGKSMEQKTLDRDTSFRIHLALHALEEPYREVFELRVFGELSFREIGMIFGKTENWSRVTYHRARLKLQERMCES